MFTGLIIELGEINSLERQARSARLSVKGKAILDGIALGDSIAVNGVCLTVVKVDRNVVSFDVSFETLKSTNLGELRRGDRVNLEPSLTPKSKLGGHFVTGHVEATGRLRSRSREGNAERIVIEAPTGVLRYLVPKGSVAVDGISLTVVDVLDDAFTLVIIPHTAAMTTIGFRKTGESVNLEPDILAKYVARFLATGKGEPVATPQPEVEDPFFAKLKQSGFV